MNKIIFTDLDGTLLNDQSAISEYTRNTIIDFINRGNRLVFSSGRSLPSVIKVANELGLAIPGTYIASCNGTQIYDLSAGETIFESRMNMKNVIDIWDYAYSDNLHIQTYSDDSLIIKNYDEEVRYYTVRCPLPVIETDNPHNILAKGPCKMLAIDLHNHDKLTAFSEYISSTYPELTTMFSNPLYLEIFNKEAGKGNALKYICKYLNTEISNSYAFGDEENDISMLKAAGTGVAMCNGNSKIFDFSDEISEYDNNNDGLAKYIEKID